MPKYNYVAVNMQNKKVVSSIDARDESDFRKLLRARQLVPVKFKISEENHVNYRLRAKETAEFSRQLSSMLGSGITVVRALEIIKDRDLKKQLRLIYQKLHKDLQQGYTLSEAMRLQPKAFPELLVNMYATGEASGQLEQVAVKMAVHYEKEHRLNSKIKSAMTYPVILLVATIIVTMVIFGFIIPRFFELFKDIEVPVSTKVILAFSTFLQSNWYWVIIGILILIAIFQLLLTIRKFALLTDAFKLRLPIVGKLLKIIYTARFARTLSSLYSSGLSMISALDITATIIGNKFIEDQFSGLIKEVRNGEPLNAAVGKIKGFDSKLSSVILIGEESGRLDSMLESTAESFDYEAEMATGRLVQLLEPIMIVIMGAAICVIIISVIGPIFAIYNSFE